MHANMHDSLLMRACLVVPLPVLVCCVHQQYGAFVAWQRPSATVCFSMAWSAAFIFLVPSMSWSVLLAARVDCCSGSLSAVFVTCAADVML
jgi:hypothetical protein